MIWTYICEVISTTILLLWIHIWELDQSTAIWWAQHESIDQQAMPWNQGLVLQQICAIIYKVQHISVCTGVLWSVKPAPDSFHWLLTSRIIACKYAVSASCNATMCSCTVSHNPILQVNQTAMHYAPTKQVYQHGAFTSYSCHSSCRVPSTELAVAKAAQLWLWLLQSPLKGTCRSQSSTAVSPT